LYRIYSQRLKERIVKNPILKEKNGILIPQPTRFWILDKDLRSRISKLEEKGVISEFEERVTEDDKLFEFFLRLHRIEIDVRRDIMLRDYPQIYKSDNKYHRRLKEVLLNTGIGGIREFDKKPFKVKCLHLWTAYHLGDERFKNPIGEYVLERV